MAEPFKKYNTVGSCGIDCGLCPRFYTKGNSACPGCGARNFKAKHPACGCLTCCLVKNGLEVCSECHEYPCRRFEVEKISRDSFVTHAKIFTNLDFVKKNGIASFIKQQKIRMNILNDFLEKYDDGRSKSFYCICCALLPVEKLQKARGWAEKMGQAVDIEEKIERLKEELRAMAAELKIELKLNTAVK